MYVSLARTMGVTTTGEEAVGRGARVLASGTYVMERRTVTSSGVAGTGASVATYTEPGAGVAPGVTAAADAGGAGCTVQQVGTSYAKLH